VNWFYLERKFPVNCNSSPSKIYSNSQCRNAFWWPLDGSVPVQCACHLSWSPKELVGNWLKKRMAPSCACRSPLDVPAQRLFSNWSLLLGAGTLGSQQQLLGENSFNGHTGRMRNVSLCTACGKEARGVPLTGISKRSLVQWPFRYIPGCQDAVNRNSGFLGTPN